jgi:hypothetical protein
MTSCKSGMDSSRRDTKSRDKHGYIFIDPTAKSHTPSGL